MTFRNYVYVFKQMVFVNMLQKCQGVVCDHPRPILAYSGPNVDNFKLKSRKTNHTKKSTYKSLYKSPEFPRGQPPHANQKHYWIEAAKLTQRIHQHRPRYTTGPGLEQGKHSRDENSGPPRANFIHTCIGYFIILFLSCGVRSKRFNLNNYIGFE